MRITKFVHSCLLVETSGANARTALFDPGVMSTVDPAKLTQLDDIFITHVHTDHLNIDVVKQLVVKFPDVRICGTAQVVEALADAGITATDTPPQGATLFDSPHEALEPWGVTPQEQGYHYLDTLTHPGDCHHFRDTKPVLALPVQAPWGSMVGAIRQALQLRPKFIIPIHDWHWSDAARTSSYDGLETFFKKEGIVFIKPVNGEPFELNV
jgi:L-ascorbate metabolism protein UlaG (beta-lactamase superfamily)